MNNHIEDKTKKCSGKLGCGIIKPLSEFNIKKDTGKHMGICRECYILYRKDYYHNNKGKILKKSKQYREENSEKIKKNNIQYYKNNKDKINSLRKVKYKKNKVARSKLSKQYYKKNRDRILKKVKDYASQNKEKIKEYKKNYGKNNRVKINKYKFELEKNNINIKLANNLRKRLNRAIKINQKTGSAVSDLGCSVAELILYLEKQFYNHKENNEMMTWKNYGFRGWHIDHIKPLSSFDLTDRKQFLEACNYTNLQPLWAEENLSKGSKYI